MDAKRVKQALVIMASTGLLSWASSAQALVQLGYHMDFVLKDGTTVRVYPEAEERTGAAVQPPLPRYDPRVSTKPVGGDPCARLEQKYKERIGQSQRETARFQPQPKRQPSWLRSTPKLKGFYGYIGRPPAGWYYLPAEPKLSYKEGRPEATFVKFITDEETGKNAAEGGIFHLMVTYGLTKDQEEELRSLLIEAVPGTVLKGLVDLAPAKSGDNFVITSGTLSDKGFAPTGILSSGRAPTVPGGKAAIAGRLSGLGAQLIAKSFENPTADMSVTFAYDYIAKTQAFDAEVVINLDIVREAAECSLKTQDTERKRRWGGGWFIIPYVYTRTETTRVSRQELEEAYNTMIALGAVNIRIDQNLPDVDVSAIESSLMQAAMESFVSLQKTFASPEEFERLKAQEKDKRQPTADPSAAKWEVYKVRRKQEKLAGTIRFQITKGIAVYRTHSMTGNMGGLLRKHKNDVFTEVVLNDPFFKRGTITVDLDTEALELFEKNMVNNASVDVVIPFKGQNPYQNNDIFTRKGVQEGKILTKFTFATRGVDTSSQSCPFKYIESWSLAGGGKWPPNPEPKCSKEMAVTLTPPIVARTIDVEADLDEMERAGLRGADVRLRHRRYGIEKTETVRFRLAKPEPFVSKTVFVDKPSAGTSAPVVEYSIVFTHKERGALEPTPWQKLEGDFVFANISGLPTDYLRRLKSVVTEIKALLER